VLKNFHAMQKFIPLIQYLPLSLFVGIARVNGFTEAAWSRAFQFGAVIAVLELIILLPLMKNKLSRLIGGANLFLFVGGAGFFFKISSVITFLDSLREAGIIFFVGIVSMIAMLVTPTGVFEESFSKNRCERKFSVYFLLGVSVAFFWALQHRGNTLVGGVAPFIFLILLKQVLQRRMLAAII